MDKITKQWSSIDYTPSKAWIKIAANLAAAGHLNSELDSLHCEELEIEDNDITGRTQTPIHVKKV